VKDLRIAAVCMRSEPGDMLKNLESTESYVSEASEMGADLICFPELSITGYTLEVPIDLYKHHSQESIVRRIGDMARKKDLVVLAGIIEAGDQTGPYISQIVAGPDGLLGLYRKTHLPPPEKEIYRAGGEIPLFGCRGFTFGVQLCYESHFPEISRVMALKGAELILLPHASPRGNPEEKMESWLRHLPSRAFDNSLFVVACNQVGETSGGLSFPGVILGIDPSGRIIESYGGSQERMILIELKGRLLEEVRNHRMRHFLPHRRPELYEDICSR
jgi:predicted amidohydrolase